MARRAPNDESVKRQPTGGAGVSNQPSERDSSEQEQLPPRGQRRSGNRPPHG